MKYRLELNEVQYKKIQEVIEIGLEGLQDDMKIYKDPAFGIDATILNGEYAELQSLSEAVKAAKVEELV